MPTINANTTVQIALPAGQDLNGTGAGIATVGNGASGIIPLTNGSPWQIGPFDRAQTVHITATSTVVYVTEEALTVPSAADRLSPSEVAATQALVSGAGESYGVDYNATPAQNVARMNLALQQNRLVTLTKPGQYLFGGPGQGGLLIPSNTTLIIGQGVEMIAAAATYQPLIRNANAFATGTTLTGVSVVFTGLGLKATIDWPGIGLLHPVGSWIGILNLAGSNSSNRGYQGVYLVREATPNQIAFQLFSSPPSGGNSATGAIVYPADSNIRIIGGVWDGNETGQAGSGYQDGDPRQCIHSMRNVQNLIVRGVQYRKGEAWCFGSNNLRDFTVEDVDADTWSGDAVIQAHDIIHLAGGHRNGLIQRITADCDDNTVGMTLDDIVNSSAVPVSYAAAGLYFPGDTYDITIRDIAGRSCEAAMVALWGNTNYAHHSTTVERVTAGRCGGAAVQINAPYAATNMMACNGGLLTVRDISGNFNGAPVRIQSEGAWEHISVSKVRNGNPAFAPLVQLTRSAATQTISRLDIEDVGQWTRGSSNNRTQPVIDIADSNINDLRIAGLPTARLTGVSLVKFGGTVGAIANALIESASGVASASGATFIASCENTNASAATLGQLTIRDCTMTATGGAGGIVQQTASGRVTNVRIDNSTQTGGVGKKSILNGTNPAAVTEVSVAVV
jgi:hypothetical protein